ncbi:MAG: hypothetical protein WA317_09960 [Mycobacterium sp.]|uniref:hypothetical protein n=1 Tax=Mycobacterium sp. TaxID=1785 RepID=UPI003CC5EA57
MAVAFADDYTFVPATGSQEDVTGIFGLLTAPPATGGSIQETQPFEFYDTTTGMNGTVNADANIFTDPFGDSNQELFITPGLDTTGTDVPPVGSVFDTFKLGFDTGLQNVYSAIPTANGDVVSDTFSTPFGSLSIPFPFYDAAAVPGSDVGNSAFADYYGIFPTGPDATSAITGDPPLDFAAQGFQPFETAGNTFQAATFNTSDLFANTSEAILVTNDISGGSGTAAGDVPPVGSVFNVLNLFGNNTGVQDIYSAIPTPGGDVVSDSLVTPFGNIPIPITFDAAAVHPVDVPLAGGYDIIPSTIPETLTGIGGVPPLDAVIQGTQTFDVDATGGAPGAGSFDADVSTASTPFGINDEALLVTSAAGTQGTAAGDVPPVGSDFNIFTFGDSGFENILADLPSVTPGGADVISDTLVTPLGDFSIPISDALAGLGGADTFLDPLLGSLTSLF